MQPFLFQDTHEYDNDLILFPCSATRCVQLKVIHFHKYHKGPFKYYVIKEVGGWGGQMMMFDDKVGGWGRLNDDVSKKYTYLGSTLYRIFVITYIFLEKSTRISM